MKEVAAEAALLVDPLNVREISEALARVAEDQALRNSLSARGLKRAAEFSWERTAQLTLDVYREVVDMERSRVSDPPAAFGGSPPQEGENRLSPS
jgi:glycosyltransferase involved in cell wall biosynthesis